MGTPSKKVRNLIVLLVLTVFFFFGLEPLVDRLLNSQLPLPESEKKLEIPQLHQQLFVSDLHADTLLWGRDLLEETSRGHVDVPRLRKGRVALQAFSVITQASFIYKQKNSAHPDGITLSAVAGRWPLKTWKSLSARALFQADKIREAVEKSNGQFRLIRTRQELIEFRRDREKDPDLVGAWLTIEGGHALEGDLNNLERLFEAGFRMIGPVHLFDNELAGSRSGFEQKGLTGLGRQWIKSAEKKKIIIDLAHLSDEATQEILTVLSRPPILSHTGIQAVCSIPRNLSDDLVKKVAAKKGLIGVGLWEEVLCGQGIEGVVKSIKHICQLVGCQHVALGSDWDGTVKTVVDAEHVGKITAALISEGFSEKDVRAIMGENVYRFLSENLP